MNPSEFFFNFYMGRELTNCGNLLYNGFQAIENEQPVFDVEDDKNIEFLDDSSAFLFFVNHSISFERMGKIIILFLINKNNPEKINDLLSVYYNSINPEYSVNLKKEKFSKIEYRALNAHNNLQIIDLINTLEPGYLNLSRDERYFFETLDKFYANNRYGQFHPKTTIDYNKNAKDLNTLLNYALNKRFDASAPNTCDRKEYSLYSIGALIQQLIHQFYTKIDELANYFNIYTTETVGYSNAETIFLNYQNSVHNIFVRNRNSRIELMYFFISPQLKIPSTDSYQPLDLDVDSYQMNEIYNSGESKLLDDTVSDLLDIWGNSSEPESSAQLDNIENKIFAREETVKKRIRDYVETHLLSQFE